MTWPVALAASCLRSALVMIVGVIVARWLVVWHRGTASRAVRRVQIVLLMAVFLTPNLVVGFGYRAVSINLLNQRWLNELLYFGLIVFEFVPAAFWLLLASPPPSLSEEAWYVARLARGLPQAVGEECCRQAQATTSPSPQPSPPLASRIQSESRLRGRGSFFPATLRQLIGGLSTLAASTTGLGSWRMRLWFWWRGCGETLVGPAALLFVLSFQETELAALMQVRGWPERLFTDHVKGVPAFTTFQLIVWPVLIQLPFVIPLLSRLGVAASTMALSALAEKTLVRRPRPAVWWLLNLFAVIWVVAGLGLIIGEPMWHLVDGVRRTGRTIVLQPRWVREVWDAVLLAGTCVGVTWGVAWLMSSGDGVQPRRVGPTFGSLKAVHQRAGIATLVPGLMGTLALGLLVAGFFQRFVPRMAYTPVPLVLAECLWLWPRVILVRQSIAARTRVAAHQISLLSRSGDAPQRARAGALWWHVAGRPLAGGVLLVAWWCYLEVMLPTILAMPGFEPAPKMMYNHLHFGQLEALGVKLAMILAAPLGLGVMLFAAMKFLSGRRAT